MALVKLCRRQNNCATAIAPNKATAAMSKETEQFFTGLKDDFHAYVNTQLQLARLTIYEKSARAVALLVLGIAGSLMLLFVLLFIFLVMGFWLGRLLNSTATGLSLVAVAYVAVFAVLILLRKRLQEKIENLVIHEFTKDDEYGDGE